MKLTKKQYNVLAPHLPLVRGNVRVSHRQFLDALLYLAETGSTWRQLPKEFGPWHTVYMRMRRWSKNGTLQKVSDLLQKELLIDVNLSALPLNNNEV